MKLHYVLMRLPRRGLVAFCALFALLVLLSTQARPASASTALSFIRLINASPEVGTVDVFVDGAKFLSNAQYGSVTDYLQLPAGSHKVQLALIGKGIGASVLVEKLSVQAGSAYTVAAIGTKSSRVSLQVFVDDNRMVSGKSTVRVYDLSPRSGTLSVKTGTSTLIGVVSYPQSSNYQSLAAGPYKFTFSSSQSAIDFVDQVTLKINTVTSLFVVGVLHGTPSLQVIYVQVKGLPRLLAATGGDPNALPLNASKFAPLIPLPLGVLALAGIALVWFTRYWPFSRQKGSIRLRKLFGAALGVIIALLLSLGGLSFASLIIHQQAPAPSARLIIPAIGVNANIEAASVQHNGAMDTPRQSPWDDVGLYSDGPRPGQQGSAVIAGHLDRPGGNRAVFWLLSGLHVGDLVQFVDAHGRTQVFHVTRIEVYPVQDTPMQEIFGNTNGRFLNLTTCTGDWIPSQHQRAMRLVVYTSFGPAPANTSSVPSSAPLTLPSSSSHVAPLPAAPSHSSDSTTSTAVPSSYSSVGSSAPTQTPLPAAIRQPVTVKLLGINQQVSRQLTQTQVVTTTFHQASSQLTRIPVVGTKLHQIYTQLTHTPVIGSVLRQTSKQLTSMPVVGTVLQRVNNQLTHSLVVSTVLHQANSQLTRVPVVGTVLQRASKQLTQTPVVGMVLHRANSQLSHIPVVSTVLHQVNSQLTHTPAIGKSFQQPIRQVLHTPVVGTVLHQANSQLTHTPVVGTVLHQASKQLTRMPAVGAVLHRANSQQPNTSVVGKSLPQANTLQSNTPTSAVGKSLPQTSTQQPNTPVVGTVLHQANSQQSNTPAVGKSLPQTSAQQTSAQQSNTPAVGKSLPQTSTQQTSAQQSNTPAVGNSLPQAQK